MENEALPTILSAIDTLLCLHFASSTAIPLLHGLCSKATHLTKRRVDQSVVEQIVAFDPTLYKVVFTSSECNDYGLSVPSGISVAKFGASIPTRKAKFEQLIKESKEAPKPCKLSSVVVSDDKGSFKMAIGSVDPFQEPSLKTQSSTSSSPFKDSYPPEYSSPHKDSSPLKYSSPPKYVSPLKFSSPSNHHGLGARSASLSPSKKLVDTLNLLPVTPTKKKGGALDFELSSPSELPDSPSKSKFRSSPTKISKTLSNSPKKFLLQQKPVEAGGLSLLERIKQKEKQRNLEKESYLPEKVYHRRLLYKLAPIYDIIYELSSSDDERRPQFKSFSLPKMVSMIKDSLTLNISEEEIEDTIRELSKLLPERVEIIKQGTINAIKVYRLNRSEDIEKIDKLIANDN